MNQLDTSKNLQSRETGLNHFKELAESVSGTKGVFGGVQLRAFEARRHGFDRSRRRRESSRTR